MAENDRQLALRALRDTLADGAARPAERVRAAEALLRAQADDLGQAADLLEASDHELLALARGETGGTPPNRGPGDSGAAAVPSHAVQVPAAMGPKEDPLLANGGGPLALPTPLTATRNPFLVRGPKKDPAKGNMPPAVSAQFDPKGQNGHDPDPWT